MLYKVTVKSNLNAKGVRLEKGMFVDMVTSSYFSNPLNYNPGENKPKINNLFMSKYGIDLLKKDLISVGHLEAEKIS